MENILDEYIISSLKINFEGSINATWHLITRFYLMCVTKHSMLLIYINYVEITQDIYSVSVQGIGPT